MNYSVIISAVFFGAFFLTILCYCMSVGRDWNRSILTTIVLVLAIMSITACATAPYIDAGIGQRMGGTEVSADGYRIDHATTGFIAIGLQFKHGRCEYVHTSHPFEGVPFNNKKELWTDIAQCSVRIGGKIK